MYDIAQVGLSRTNEFTQTRQPKGRLGVRGMLLYTYIRVWTVMLALFANALVFRAHGFYCIFFVFLCIYICIAFGILTVILCFFCAYLAIWLTKYVLSFNMVNQVCPIFQYG